MRDPQQTADRVEIEALRAEFSDAVMMREPARIAALFTDDGVLCMPDVPVEFVGPEIREGCERLQAAWDFFVQTSHGGTVRFGDDDTASGRTYLHELLRLKDGMEAQNYGVYHDRYRRTADGWRFAERVYEVRYFDASPLSGTDSVPAFHDRSESA